MSRISIFPLLCISIALGLGLAACANVTVTPDVTVTFTAALPTLTPTEAPTATATLTSTPEATATPEAPVMTLEKWESKYGGTVVGPDGTTHEVLSLSDTRYFEVFGEEDIDKIANLKEGTPLAILYTNEIVRIYGDPDFAAEEVASGRASAVVVEKGGPTPTLISDASLWAAYRARQAGTNNIVVEFDESAFLGPAPQGVSFLIQKDIPMETDASGRIICPVMRLPKHFRVYYWANNKPIEFPVTEDMLDPIYWLNAMIESGVQTLSVFPARP